MSLLYIAVGLPLAGLGVALLWLSGLLLTAGKRCRNGAAWLKAPRDASLSHGTGWVVGLLLTGALWVLAWLLWRLL